MWVIFALAILLAPAPLFGWGCDGHRVVAFIARVHLTPATSQEVDRLLHASPVNVSSNRYCPDPPADLMAAVASWADDIRTARKNGAWHYIDIPRTVTKRTKIGPWCPEIWPSASGKDATGCVVDAIEHFAKILADKSRNDADRAEALRYLIHFVGDIHQPLHAIDDSDQGGNCDPVHFSGDTNATNLHSLWDTRLLTAEMKKNSYRDAAAFAAGLDVRFASLFETLSNRRVNDPEAWAWESDGIARRTVYGKLKPAIAPEPGGSNAACAERRKSVTALHIVIDGAYAGKVQPVMDKQLARAGFRLARLLNATLHN
ncbi:MAG TPA: S1/P1 nuclease [Bryobacteraceae bacterium]|jgi:hypothetical protein